MPHNIALLSCAVFDREIALWAGNAGHIRERRVCEIALHDCPDIMRGKLQAEIHALDVRDDIDAIVLAYGLCGRGTAGLRAGRHPVVLPRAHDCITVFLGSKERYAEHQRRCPTCYYYTPGWNRSRRVPGPDKIAAMREELRGRFDDDDVEFLIESEKAAWERHDTATYLDLGTSDAEEEADYARQCADSLGWKFDRIQGDPSLLRDLLEGRWDDGRFQIIPPGGVLEHSPDERIFRAGTNSNKTP